MVSFTFATLTAAVALFAQSAVAAPSPNVDTNGVYVKRAASCNFPKPSKTTTLSAPKVVSGTFDGGLVRFERGAGACTGQKEGGDKDAVFLLENGATIKNVVIGANQAEGIHCKGSCNVYNVWFEDVCEDAITLKQTSGTSNIVGGGAKNASDKVIQHNGGGNVIIDSYCVQDFGKLYRSCGNCKEMPARHVEISGGSASNGKILVGINPNMGDTAKISGIQLTNVPKECITFEGVTDGSEPKEVGTCDSNAGSGSGSGSGDSTEAPATPTTPADGSETPAASEVADPVETSADGSQGDDQSGDDQSGDNDDGDKDESDDDKKDDDSDDENKDEQSDNENQDQDSESENQESADNQQAQPSQPNFSFGSGGFGGF